MCLQASAVRPYQRWRWAGDEIVHSPVIPAARRIPGSRNSHYPIDIREYLSIDSNAVVHDWLHTLVSELPLDDRLRFHDRGPGCFDFRAAAVANGLGKLNYKRSDRRFDDWLFPEETLYQKGGDCEDLAFALAALLRAAGISPDCLRVALGVLIDRSTPGREKRWDHAWVVYQLENGAWQIIDSVAHVERTGKRSTKRAKSGKAGKSGTPTDIEYVPHFVFNENHLWRVRTPELRAAGAFADYLGQRDGRFWAKFDPSFAANVHNDIFDQALDGISTVDLALVKAVSLGVDANVLAYDPRDHFDFAYIDAGWSRVAERLKEGSLRSFALAMHGVADFYAHSLYGYFAGDDGTLAPYDPAHPVPPERLEYGFLAAMPRPGSACGPQAFQDNWKGKLISGQWWRWYSTYPKELRADLDLHRCLPDHDALAVDSATRSASHLLFDESRYAAQFAMRKNAAIAHIKSYYRQWKGAAG
jgi:Transglutaminase-like superfamily